jgi:hypothetical protein
MPDRQEYLSIASLKSSYAGQVENNSEQLKKQIVPTASAILEDGTIVEMAFQPEQRRTFFARRHSPKPPVGRRLRENQPL